jgi:hypothetical protein
LSRKKIKKFISTISLSPNLDRNLPPYYVSCDFVTRKEHGKTGTGKESSVREIFLPFTEFNIGKI